MIKELKDVEDIAKILQLEDDVLETSMPCTKGEWVQFLCQNINNPKLKYLADIENGVIQAYIILLDSVSPPLFDSAVILYLWSPYSHKTTRRIVEASKKWAKKIGAKRGMISVPLSHSDKYLHSFGGEKIGNVYSWEIK